MRTTTTSSLRRRWIAFCLLPVLLVLLVLLPAVIAAAAFVLATDTNTPVFSTTTTAFIAKPFRKNFDCIVQLSQRRRHYETRRLGSTCSSNSCGDSFDDDELRQRIRFEQTKERRTNLIYHHEKRQGSNKINNDESTVHEQQQARLLPQQPLDHVYIVSFVQNSTTTSVSTTTDDMTDDATTTSSPHHCCTTTTFNGGIGVGIHSIEYPSGKNVILAFTNPTDCDTFVQRLRQQNFYTPMAQNISVEALVDFCLTVGVMIELVPDGVDVIPPKYNVQPLGLQRQTQQQQIQQQHEELEFAFYMLDDEMEDIGVVLDPYNLEDGAIDTTTTTISIFE